MKVIQIVGYKNTGKTTVGERLLAVFSAMGLHVVAVKHSHSSDESSKTVDTERLYNAGAEKAYFCNDTMTLCTGKLQSLEKIITDTNHTYDICIIEGYKSFVYPRIVCMDTPSETLLDGAFAIAAKTSHHLPESGVPVFNALNDDDIQTLADLCLKLPNYPAGLDCGACGMTCRQLYLERTCGEAMVCVAEQAGTISIIVNGIPIPLAPFVQNVALQTFSGFVSSLKGYAPGDVAINFTTRD